MTKRQKAFLPIVDIDGNEVHRAYVDKPEEGLRGADLGGLIAPYGQLQGLDLTGANLYWATLRDADLSFATLCSSDLRGAILERAICRNTNFRNANLGFDKLGGATNLQGADLSSSDLNGAVFTGAVYDDHTKFPAGFSPESRGLVHVREKQV